jgi:hypothetical protein
VAFVVGIFGRDLQALPLGQLVGELAVPGGQLADLPGCLLHVLLGGGDRVAGLGCGSELGFRGAQRRPGLIRVAAAQLSVSGNG